MVSNVSILFCLLVLSLTLAISAGESELVLSLDNSNFTDIVAKHDFIVVEFYAPWCPHCKELAPEYEKAASTLSSHDPPIVLAKLDANDDANQELADHYDIKGFPTLMILRSGGKSVQEYKGPHDAESIVEYLKKHRGPASIEIKSADDATNLISKDKIVVVGVFPKFSGEEFETFMALADKLRPDYDFGHTLDAKHLPQGEKSVTGPLVRLFKPFDELVVDSKDFNFEVMEKFVEESSLPIVTVFNNDPKNNPFVVKFFNSPDNKAILFVNFSSDVADSFKTKYHEVAKQYKGDGIAFLLADVEASESALQFFGLNKDQTPLIIIQTQDRQKYLKANLQPDHIASWVKDYKKGKVAPHRKSQPVPEVNNDPVKVVVADSLEDMVIKSGKNAFLEFYAPWCGHCQKLAPILDEVAMHYDKDTEVLIGKLDATANDFPNDLFDVKGYPTLYLRSKSGKLVKYEGNSTKEEFIDFIEKYREKAAGQREAGKDEL